MLGLGDLYQQREDAAQRAPDLRTEAECLRDGDCPACRGAGCLACDRTGYAWRCLDCDAILHIEPSAFRQCGACVRLDLLHALERCAGETLAEARALDLAEATGADWAEVDGRRVSRTEGRQET